MSGSSTEWAWLGSCDYTTPLWSLSSRTALKHALCYSRTKGSLRHFMSCQHRILGVHWYDLVPNTVITQRPWLWQRTVLLNDVVCKIECGQRHSEHFARTVYLAQFAKDVWRSSHTFDVFLKLLQLTLPWSWSWTHAQAIHLDAISRRHWTHRLQSVEYC